MPKYVTVRHSLTDAVTVISEKVLPSFQSRGWAEDKPKASKSKAVTKTPVSQDDPVKTSEVEENA